MEMVQGKDMTERAYEVALEVLQNHKPYPLPEGAAETMSEIVFEFEKELKLDNKVA
jgi:trimethylamine--corrinoid protein Co-methyltransferase